MQTPIDPLEMRTRLREQRQALRARLEEEKERGASESLLNPDRADLAREYSKRDRHLSLLEQLRDHLTEIDGALDRIEKGTYGRCQKCGQPIQPERLKALPSAPLCIDCKREETR